MVGASELSLGKTEIRRLGLVPESRGFLRHPRLFLWVMGLPRRKLRGFTTLTLLEVPMKPVPIEVLGKVSGEVLNLTKNSRSGDPFEPLMPLLETWAKEDPSIAGFVQSWVSKAFDRYGLNQEGGEAAINIAIPAYVVYRAMRLHFEEMQKASRDPNSN